MAETSLEEQRQLIEARLAQLRSFMDNDPQAQALAGFFQGQAPQGLLGQLQARASGTSSPFGANTIASLIADSTGANARGVQRDSDLIRRSFANSGLSGSGLETSALVNARRQATAANTAARRQITSRAELANFQARERAQQQVQGFLQQQLQAQQALVNQRLQNEQFSAGQEINHRQQFRDVQGGAAGTDPMAEQNRQRQIAWFTAQANAPTATRQPFGLGGYQTTQGVMPSQQAFARERLNQLIAGI